MRVLSHLHDIQDTVFPHWAYAVLCHHGGVLLGPGRDADWRKKTGRRRWIVNKEDLAAEDRKRIEMVWWAPAPGPDHRARYTVIPLHCWHTPVLLILLGREGELLSGPLSPPCLCRVYPSGDGHGEGMLGQCPPPDLLSIPAESQPSLFCSFPGRDADWRKKTGRRRWIVTKEDLVAEERRIM